MSNLLLYFLRCNNCENMAVYKCYECTIVLCEDCSRKHQNEKNYQFHTMQFVSDSFILNSKFHLGFKIVSLRDIQCSPNGILVATSMNMFTNEVMLFSVNGKSKHEIQLKERANRIAVVDTHTVALSLWKSTCLHVALVDIHQRHVSQYIHKLKTPMNSNLPFIYIENHLYVADILGINVIDMLGTVKRRIELRFTPEDMCYNSDSQRIYCIDNENSQLICIDRDGNTIFTFAEPNVIHLNRLTIDNEGNVLVMCIKRDNDLECVIRVDVNGKLRRVVITNIPKPKFCQFSYICFHRSTNSVVIGVDKEVYIYKGQ